MPEFAPADAASRPIFILGEEGLADWLVNQSQQVQAWLAATGFKAGLGDLALLPGAQGLEAAVLGYGTAKSRARMRFGMAGAASSLPVGDWHFETDLAGDALEEAVLGWLLAQYRFDRYRPAKTALPRLKVPDGVNAKRLLTIASGEFLTRDLINTPASDMGPEELEAAFRTLAETHGASVTVTYGDDLLAQNFPMIHAVGRASPRAPRLLDMRWGDAGPELVLVGKGVCFDTGGLDIKPSSGMLLMKKDMGGAAAVLGLAHMIMGLGLTLRLRVLVPAVENAISGAAMRPRDILTSRKGLTV
jgi:leucyl aminopeptidase